MRRRCTTSQEEPHAKCSGPWRGPQRKEQGASGSIPCSGAASCEVRSFPGASCPSQSLDREGLAASTLVTTGPSDHGPADPVWKTASPPPPSPLAAPVPSPEAAHGSLYRRLLAGPPFSGGCHARTPTTLS